MGELSEIKKDLQRWKDKYFEQQEAFELKAQDADESKAVLQRLLMRICLSAEGLNPNLDIELKALRDDIKSQTSDAKGLSERLKRIDKILVGVDEAKAKDGEVFITLVAELLDSLQLLQPPRGQKSSIKKLSRSVNKQQINASQNMSVLAEYVSIQSKVISWIQSGENKSSGFIGRLLQGNSSPPQAKPIGKNGLGHELDIEAEGTKNTDEIIPGFSAISTHVQATLNHLLDQLTLPQSSERSVATLREKIDGKLNWYELGPTLDDVASVVLSAVGKGQREFGSFLTDIDERLFKIQGFVMNTLRANGGMREEEKALDKTMRERISQMTNSLEQADDVEALKASIKSHVDSLSLVLDKFSEEGSRVDALNAEELDAMTLRFREMEEETSFFRKRLKEERSKALTDALTQLSNREAYDERFMLEFERWQRYKKPATLVMVDIDHFKDVNDHYGHLSGDKVLQILAKEIQKRIRKTDFVARYGGEEFVIVLPETDIGVAMSVIEKMREMIAKLPFHFREEEVQVTVSCGVVEFSDDVDASGLFDRADRALYQAKSLGRNRVEAWQQGI